MNEQSHVTLLIRNPVELTQFPDALHGSTLKSQSVLLSLLAIPLSASTEKAKTIQISAKYLVNLYRTKGILAYIFILLIGKAKKKINNGLTRKASSIPTLRTLQRNQK